MEMRIGVIVQTVANTDMLHWRIRMHVDDAGLVSGLGQARRDGT